MNHYSPTLKQSTVMPPLQSNYSTHYRLVWRQRKLTVSLTLGSQPFIPPSVEKQERLVDCLRRSPITLVKLDLNLGETRLWLWANACQQANKPVFLRIPAIAKLPQKKSPLLWQLKRIVDWLGAASLLLLLSPFLLAVALLIRLESPGPVFLRQWRVGERGKLFQIFQFRTTVKHSEQKPTQELTSQGNLPKLKHEPQITRIGRWLCKHGLNELPQLINVLRGEMGLIGPWPYTLSNAARMLPEQRGQLNTLPGMTGTRQEARSYLLNFNAMNRSA
jgi:lipopolysaccharide/colanic/teichoic acid biosynthesis glycosyltransferase